jgi:uncharacterized membrane protein
MYITAMGSEVSAVKIAVVLVGVITVLIGNYMPKCKPNYTIGVKLVWTLKSNANWVATHRLVGKVWLAGGILLILCALLPMPTLLYVALGLFLIMTIVPVVYSYLYYRRHKDDEGYFTVKSASESEK